MSQLACPLCGRYVSLSRFDPSGFENDIYAVNMVGLGRGKGFAVGPSFSVLNDVTITGAIASRCRIILGLIDGVDAQSNEVSILRAEIEKLKAARARRRVLSSGDLSAWRAEVGKWKGEVVRERRAREDLHAELADLEGRAKYWRSEASRLQRGQEEHAAELAGLEGEGRRWRSMATGLRAKVERLESELGESDDDDVDDEEEMLAVEEMQEILDRVNTSANATFRHLSDAVDFLLEGG